MRTYRVGPCEDCRREVRRPVRAGRPHVCTDCAIQRVARNAVKLTFVGVAYRAVKTRQGHKRTRGMATPEV